MVVLQPSTAKIVTHKNGCSQHAQAGAIGVNGLHRTTSEVQQYNRTRQKRTQGLCFEPQSSASQAKLIPSSLLTASDFALVDELLQKRKQVQQLLVGGVVKPALDRDAVVNLQQPGSGIKSRQREPITHHSSLITHSYSTFRGMPRDGIGSNRQ